MKNGTLHNFNTLQKELTKAMRLEYIEARERLRKLTSPIVEAKEILFFVKLYDFVIAIAVV
jgi:hypothetical protein